MFRVCKRSREASDHRHDISGVGSWSFPPADGLTIPRTVQFTPRLLVNSVRAAVASAVEGRGVTRPLSYQVAEHVRDGRLQIVLRQTSTPRCRSISSRRRAGFLFRKSAPSWTSPCRACGAVRVPHCGRRRLTLDRSHSGERSLIAVSSITAVFAGVADPSICFRQTAGDGIRPAAPEDHDRR